MTIESEFVKTGIESSISQEVRKEIASRKADYGEAWYLYFNNFTLRLIRAVPYETMSEEDARTKAGQKLNACQDK